MKILMKALWVFFMAAFLQGEARGQFDDPFSVQLDREFTSSGAQELHLRFTVPAGHYLYKDEISLSSRGARLEIDPVSGPTGRIKYDETFKKDVEVIDGAPEFVFSVKGALSSYYIVVEYQGCNESFCFLPQQRSYFIPQSGVPVEKDIPDEVEISKEPEELPAWRIEAERFDVVTSGSGFMDADDFIAFLRGQGVNGGASSVAPVSSAKERGILITLLLVLVGGLALNLTPCVLPMIPVNIAIIGAGLGNGSTRARGFALGAAYGAGIALVYGVLGILSVLLGARFGTLNSSPWFNLGITVLFLVLALSMFGIFTIDFSRFQGGIRTDRSRRGSFALSIFMGGVAALLAGACVAPIVIWTLVLASDLYAKGHGFALALPFLLGTGMALPWPFAGAGLSFLPKPGAWMERIKQVFGIIILAAAAYYGYMTYSMFTARVDASSLAEQLDKAAGEDRPVLVDFWATWCKNCKKMEQTVFKNERVKKVLGDFTVIKYQAEDLKDEETKAVLDYYRVSGLPAFVVLKRADGDKTSQAGHAR